MGVSRERCAPVPVCGSTKMERFPQISSVLEGNVVVSYRGSGLRTRSPSGHFSTAFLPVIPRTEQDNVPSDNLCSIFLFPVLPVFPGRCLQFAFNVELRSLADVLSHDLRQTLPSHNAVPFCSVLPLIVPVFESFVRGEAEFSDRNSTGRVLDLRSLAYVSHQNYLVHAFRHDILQLLLLRASTRAATFHAAITGTVSHHQRAAELTCRCVSQSHDLPERLDHAAHLGLRRNQPWQLEQYSLLCLQET